MHDAANLLKIFWPLVLFQLLLMAWGLVDLFRRHEVKLLPRWAWILVIIFINIFGPVIYLVLGRGEE